MARFLKNKDASMGRAPGELVFIGKQKIDEPTVQIIDYDQEHLNEEYLQDIKDGISYKETSTVTWLNVYGLHDAELLKAFGQEFGLHGLVLEDISNTGQRPKMEEYDDYLYFVLKMMKYDEDEGKSTVSS